MSNKNKSIEISNIQTDFDFEEQEASLSKQLEESFYDLELLEKDREMISNPESLGKIVLEEVWKQFGNQVGLDMTNETLIQKYDREHPEEYKDIADSIMKDQRYKDMNKAMKEKQKSGNLKDAYTGKYLKQGEQANLDHVVPRKELYDNQRRKQANLDVVDLANKKQNLKPTNQNLNKSKQEKSNKEYIETRENRERILIDQNKKRNKKIDESNISDVEKRLKKEKNYKYLNNKLDANSDLMLKVDKEARKAIEKDIRINAVKQIGKKAGKDALKSMVVSALFSLLKEIVKGLIYFLKEKHKSFKVFLSKIEKSIKSFFSKIFSVVKTGVSALAGTIISEIFGSIASIFKKLSSLIKQSITSFIDVIHYLRDKNNKNKPFAVKLAQIGKIVTVGLVGVSSIFLGDVFEKLLLKVPGMQIKIPQVGTLANIIGLFLSSLVSGVIGAIILNIINKFIAKRLKQDSNKKIIDKKNEIINIQQKQIFTSENHLIISKEKTLRKIATNHKLAQDDTMKLLENICNDDKSKDYKSDISKNKNDLIQMQHDLEDLL